MSQPTRRTRSLTRTAAALAASALLVAACGDDDDVDSGAVDDAADEVGETEQGMGAMEVQLDTLNDSGITGSATVEVNDDGTVTVSLDSNGFTGTNPHAQHLHIGGEGQCPDMGAAGDDGILDTAEGIPAYGEVKVALTTEGDVSAESALAVERFPAADDGGAVTYERTFELPSGVTADDVSNAVVVQHGFAGMGGDPAAYDGDMKSALDETLPLEATIPVACGALSQS